MHEHTAYDFQKLAPGESALVFAAYERNLPMMRRAMLQPGVALFATEDGMWRALAHLYYKRDQPELVSQLQKALRFPAQRVVEGSAGNVVIGD